MTCVAWPCMQLTSSLAWQTPKTSTKSLDKLQAKLAKTSAETMLAREQACCHALPTNFNDESRL